MGKDSPTFQLRAGARESREELFRQIPALAPGTVGLLFATTEFSELAPAFAEELAQTCQGTWILGLAQAVWTEAGELSGEPALAGFVLPRGKHTLVTPSDPRCFAEQFAARAAHSDSGTALVLLGANEDPSNFLGELGAFRSGRNALAFGGKTAGPLTLISSQGVEQREAVGLFFPRQTPARLASSSACRLLSPLVRVTASEGRVVTELDDSPALEMLEQAAAGLAEPSLLLLVLASEEHALSPLGRNIIARPIVGLDPDRRALILDPEVPLGARVAIAVHDHGAALADLERHLGALIASTRAAAPVFGIFLASERRRRSPLSIEGEVRRVAARFPGLPLIGLTTSLELSPFEGQPAAHVDASVLALFSAVN